MLSLGDFLTVGEEVFLVLGMNYSFRLLHPFYKQGNALALKFIEETFESFNTSNQINAEGERAKARNARSKKEHLRRNDQ